MTEWMPPNMRYTESACYTVARSRMGKDPAKALGEYIAREMPKLQAESSRLGVMLALAVETTEAQRRYIDELEAKLKPRPIETAPEVTP